MALVTSAAAEVCQLLVKAAANATLISIVHNPALLPLLAERVIGLKNGRIAFDLPVAAVNDEKLLNLYRPAAAQESTVSSNDSRTTMELPCPGTA